MKKLLKYLSPFAPDQSGACGVLYELGGIIVICDAGGCAGNICGFDEPRWFKNKSAVFSAGLRDMDAIMGRDDKLIEKLSRAHEQLGAKFSALVATPVPAVIGTDMKALKRMAEKKLGIPCIAVNAIGTRYYDEGESEAWLQLFETFTDGEADNNESDNRESGNSGETPASEKIGVIGATPFETGYSTDKPLKSYLEKQGLSNTVIYTVGTTLEDVEKAAGCEKNLVVSTGGIKAADYLKERFGVPYEVGFPFIPDEVVECAKGKLGKIAQDLENKTESKTDNKPEIKAKVLIVHSQFAANELRKRLVCFTNESGLNKGIECSFEVGTFFTMLDEYAEAGDIHFGGEDDLWSLAAEGDYDLIIADSDMERLIRAAGYKGEFSDFPHFAVSGRMNDDSVMFFS
ncbi:MAG: nitrogenase component 1 [Eubacterium sp.]|nr:nitrogenase component 1 [Eubacterium sp.]